MFEYFSIETSSVIGILLNFNHFGSHFVKIQAEIPLFYFVIHPATIINS